MKTKFKRALALLLSATMLLSLSSTAFAASEYVHSFYITKQPKLEEGWQSGDAIVLSAAARANEGAVITYQWYYADSRDGLGTKCEGYNEPDAVFEAGTEYYPNREPESDEISYRYTCYATATIYGENGEILDSKKQSCGSAYVEFTYEPLANWGDFYITEQPVAPENLTYGDEINLSVEVNAPEGVRVSYQWYGGSITSSNSTLHGLTEPTAVIKEGDAGYPRDTSKSGGNLTRTYFCCITAEVLDESGNVISSRKIKTDEIKVDMKYTFGQGVTSFFVAPLDAAFTQTLAFCVLSGGMFLPISPIMFIGFLIYAVFVNTGNMIERQF